MIRAFDSFLVAIDNQDRLWCTLRKEGEATKSNSFGHYQIHHIIRSITISDPSQYQIHQISDPSEYQIHHNIRSTTISDPSNIRSTTISDPSNIRSITISDPSQYQIHQISDPSEYQIHHNIRSTTISDPSNIRSTTISDPSNIRSITISDLSQPTYSMLTSSISIRRNCLSLLDGAEPGLAMGNRNLISNFLNPRSNKNDMTSKGPIFSVWWVLYIAL